MADSAAAQDDEIVIPIRLEMQGAEDQLDGFRESAEKRLELPQGEIPPPATEAAEEAIGKFVAKVAEHMALIRGVLVGGVVAGSFYVLYRQVTDYRKALEDAQIAAEKRDDAEAKSIRNLVRSWDDYIGRINAARAEMGEGWNRSSSAISKIQRDLDDLISKYESVRLAEGRAARHFLATDTRGGSVEVQLEIDAKLREQDAERQQYVTRGVYEDRYKQAQDANKKLRQLDTEGAATTASERARIQIEADARIFELSQLASQRRAAANIEIAKKEAEIVALVSDPANQDTVGGGLWKSVEDRVANLRKLIVEIRTTTTQGESQTQAEVDEIRKNAGTKSDLSAKSQRLDHEVRLRQLVLEQSQVTADQRRSLEIQNQETLAKIQDERAKLLLLKQTADVTQQLDRLGEAERQQHAINAARLFALDQQLAVQHAAAMRALRLELTIASADPIAKVEAENEQKLELLRDRYIEKQRQGDIQGAAQVAEQIAVQEQINQQRRNEAAFALAKAKNDRLREIELGGQNIIIDADKIREDREKQAQFMMQAGWRPEVAARLAQLKLVEDSELAILASALEQKLILDEEYERRRAEITARFAAERLRATQSYTERELTQFGRQVLRGFASSLGSAFADLGSHVAAYDRAVRAAGGAQKQFADDGGAAVAKFVQDTLVGIARMAATQALYETGMALATQGLTWGVPNSASVNHWAAAAIFGGIAVGTTIGAAAIGESRGLTGAEKESAAGGGYAGGYGGSPDSYGARGAGDTGGGKVIRETVYFLVGDPFESPAETARRASRAHRLAQDLDLLQRSAG